MFKCALILAILGFTGFLCAFVLGQIGMAGLAEETARYGATLFLGAFLVLLITAGVISLQKILQQLAAYLSTAANLERKANFYLNKFHQQQLMFEFKKAKILYLAQQKRNRLLKKWSAKSSPSTIV